MTTMKTSELSELQHDLNSNKHEERKEAAKQVIAMMTIGKDVSALFPHMVRCMATQSIELKKLVYLYIINYAKSKPDLTIMAVNSFQQDSRNVQNPLMRALAVRTMSCIRIERITEYLCESLKDSLTDDDPYVKKTAATAVAKLYQTSPRLVKDHQFIKTLQSLLLDGNAIVVANACAAILEISKTANKNYFPFKKGNYLNKVLAAVADSNEWGQVFILEAIALYEVTDEQQAENIIERVLPRLAHNNPAVILSAVKVVLKSLDVLPSGEVKTGTVKKLSAPLVTLLSCEAELQYVALRNINFVLQKQPTIFENNVKVFFCKFNDPLYVKLEKIDILVKVAEDKNAENVLNELHDYTNDMDMDLVTAAVKAIGQIILKVNRSVSRAVQIIQEIVQNGQPVAMQEAVIIAKNIFRRFPTKYERLISFLVEKLEHYTEPDSKAAIFWIIGEYADKIENSETLIEQFCESFLEEPDSVKLSLLTATVKLYLKKPDESEELIHKVLGLATESADSPDLKDRAYIYWRMLSADPQKAQDVVLGTKPQIAHDTYNIYDEELVDMLIDQISNLSSIYHKTADEWREQQAKYDKRVAPAQPTAEEVKAEEPAPRDRKAKKPAKKQPPPQEESSEEEEEKKEPAPKKSKKPKSQIEIVDQPIETPAQPEPAPGTQVGGLLDLEDMLGGPSTNTGAGGGLAGIDLGGVPAQAQQQQPPVQSNDMGFGFGNEAQAEETPSWAADFGGESSAAQTVTPEFAKPEMHVALQASTPGQKGKSGLQVSGHFFIKDSTQLCLGLQIQNMTQEVLVQDFDLKFNKNAFAVSISGATNALQLPGPGQSSYAVMNCQIDKKNLDGKNPPKSPFNIQIAMKTSLDIFYFDLPCMLHCLFNTQKQMTQQEYQTMWQKIKETNQLTMDFTKSQLYGCSDAADVIEELSKHVAASGFTCVNKTSTQCNFGAMTINNLPVLFEAKYDSFNDNVSILYKFAVPPLKDLTTDCLRFVLTHQAAGTPALF